MTAEEHGKTALSIWGACHAARGMAEVPAERRRAARVAEALGASPASQSPDAIKGFHRLSARRLAGMSAETRQLVVSPVAEAARGEIAQVVLDRLGVGFEQGPRFHQMFSKAAWSGHRTRSEFHPAHSIFLLVEEILLVDQWELAFHVYADCASISSWKSAQFEGMKEAAARQAKTRLHQATVRTVGRELDKTNDSVLRSYIRDFAWRSRNDTPGDVWATVRVLMERLGESERERQAEIPWLAQPYTSVTAEEDRLSA